MEQLKNKTNDLALSQLSRWRQRIHYENILLLYEYNTIYIFTNTYTFLNIFSSPFSAGMLMLINRLALLVSIIQFKSYHIRSIIFSMFFRRFRRVTRQKDKNSAELAKDFGKVR